MLLKNWILHNFLEAVIHIFIYNLEATVLNAFMYYIQHTWKVLAKSKNAEIDLI